MEELNQAKLNFLKKERELSKYATLSNSAIRLKEEDRIDIRPNYYHDIDRIIYSLSFLRYQNKTQVFAFPGNDHVSHRMIHVQFVSKIARTIGRSLNLNEDLIEAIALGHDIGHTPLGHAGEAMLNKISRRELGEYFAHNVQSVRNLMFIENHGEGLNLSIQVLDGIFCHNGEILEPIYKPMNKTKEEFLEMYNNAYKDLATTKKYSAMTLEGCVVRISDIIAYVGRDIEDAIRLGFVNREEIPSNISKVLGNNNKDIVNTLVTDLINNSYGKGYLEFSEEVYLALNDLFNFNYKYIYNNANSKERLDYYNLVFTSLYDKYLSDLNSNNLNSSIYTFYLNKMDSNYVLETSNERKIIDYISLMTDEFLIREYEANCR